MSRRIAQRLVFSVFLACLLEIPSASADSVLVAPFSNSAGATELDWVSESFAEGLSDALVGSGHTAVAREERLAGLERLGLPAAHFLTRASLLRLAEEVGADWVVVGEFEIAEGRLRARARLLNARRYSLSEPLEVVGSFDQLLELQARLAWLCLRRLDPSLPVSQDAFQQRRQRLPISAFESYIRGLLAFDRDQQLRYLVQATRLEPRYASPVFRLGQLYLEDMDYVQAARWFSRIEPESALATDARFFLSLCLFHQGEVARARETLLPLAQRAPSRAVWNNLGVFSSRLGEGDAAAYLIRALEEDPADPDARFNLALHYLRLQHWDDALRALDESLQLNPTDTDALYLRAFALEKLGRAEEAARARQQALGDNPALGLTLERRQLDFDRLVQNFAARRPLAPGKEGSIGRPRAQAGTDSGRERHVATHIERGEDLLSRGELQAAQEELTEAILLDPASARAHFLLAEVYRRQSRISDAIAELRASVWSRDSVAARLRLAELLLAAGRAADAAEELRAVLALDPTNAAARALQARLSASPAAAARNSE